MEAVAHSPAFAKKVGIKQSVGQDFANADKGRKFKGGGMAKSDMKEDTKMDMAQDKAMIKKAFKQHDTQEHKGGKGTKLALKKGGMCGGGMSKAKKYAAGGVVGKSNKEMPTGKKMGPLGLKKGGMLSNIKKVSLKETMSPSPASLKDVGSEQGNTKYGQSKIQERGTPSNINKGDSGASVGIQGGGMKKGGRIDGAAMRGKTRAKRYC